LYNVLEQSFVSEAKQNLEEPKKGKIILMICSLKGYKGVDIFLRLAKMNQHLIFKLVVNAGKVDIDNYFKNEIIPNNLLIYPTQKDTHPFYREASILLNLSDINLWVETFGLTVLEAMAYGLPSVVPTIGGITELVEDGVNGFLVDSKNIILLNQKINYLLTNAEVYARMRNNALKKSSFFNEQYFEQQAMNLVA
jgi:glycosyltransferase involved in cell wall biosynthesis